MLNKTFLSAILLAMAVLLLAGCGSPTPAASGTPAGQSASLAGIDACTLFTKADAEKILGKPVDEATHPTHSTDPVIVDSCDYRITGGTAKDHAILIIMQPANGDLKSAQVIFTSSKQGAQGSYGSILEVRGLGDSAFWVGGEGNTLTIIKGSAMISISVSTQKGSSLSQAMFNLGGLVLSRLP